MSFIKEIEVNYDFFKMIDLKTVFGEKLPNIPFIMRIFAENMLRNSQEREVLASKFYEGHDFELEYTPVRIMMHDTTSAPALTDIAAMRDFLAANGVDPRKLSPQIQVNVSVDHSSPVNHFGSKNAFQANLKEEIALNKERYSFFKWAENTLDNFTIHPPGSGIMHTINCERLAQGMILKDKWIYPECILGTDSHTPMINALGILGWGIGGLEAESALFGFPTTLKKPCILGLKLTKKLKEGVNATDLALTLTHILRKKGLNDCFVEVFGKGVQTLSTPERMVISNMSPEYGATCVLFPFDSQTSHYFEATGRDSFERYAKAFHLWQDYASEPHYDEVLELDLSTVKTTIAGPKRPQDRLFISDVAGSVENSKIALAAITSCTNTSDLRLLIAAGLLARKARALGLKPPSYVKTSFAPGSPVAETILRRSELIEDLEALGFHIVGFGCTSCIGNSGALLPEMHGQNGVAVLSGNRNFPYRVNPEIENAFLMSPALVIAYALQGEVKSMPDLEKLWPSSDEIEVIYKNFSHSEDYEIGYKKADDNKYWQELPFKKGNLYQWYKNSNTLQPPPFVKISNAFNFNTTYQPLYVLGNDITTDHISPAGLIPFNSEAGKYLRERGETDLNTYASRRGNFEVMVRGAFANKAVKNLAKPAPHNKNPKIIIAGERYGMGSSRDWAAKAVALLGVKVILAKSFERIHRTNLIGMGILPLIIPKHITITNLSQDDEINIEGLKVTLPYLTFMAMSAVETQKEHEILENGGIIPSVLKKVMQC